MWPFTKPIETKQNPVGSSFMVSGGPSWSRSEDKKDYVREGYQMNVVIYRAIREIVQAAASIKVELHSGGEILDTHPALDLLNNPNPAQSYGQWIAEMMVNRMLFGETFAVGAGENVFAEMWAINPVDMIVAPGAYGVPSAYIHERNRKKQTFTVNPVTGESDVFFLKMYNPSDYWRGQSPLMAAAIAADTHNAGSKWNYSLLKNSARPSGLVKFKGGYPGGEQIQRMREYFKTAMQGSTNSGAVPMLADDADFVPLSQSPVDMDFLNTMKESAKYIASAFGVPLPLIDNDASTFNNMEQAKERLYTDTVIPIMQEFIGALGKWMLPRYGDGLEFKLDLDSIPALEGLRQKMFDRAVSAFEKGVLTREESRIMMGFPAEGEGDYTPTMLQIEDMDFGGDASADGLNAPVDDVQAEALNGAQISSLQGIVQSVADGLLPQESAIQLILVGFPRLTQEAAERIVNPTIGFTSQNVLSNDDLKALAYGFETKDD